MKMQRRQPKDPISRPRAAGRNREQESETRQARRSNEQADGRMMKTFRRFNQNRRLADLRPSFINIREKIKSTFVLKNQNVTVVKNFFLTGGQMYRCQWSTAACDRFGDWVSGICCENPSLCNRSGMDLTLYSTPNRSAIPFATRCEFQRSLEKPEATAPSLTICLSSSNCSGVRWAFRPELGLRARDAIPPSSIFVFQRLTLERDAPVISTTSATSYPFSSNSPPCKRRIACKEILP